ncbi:MAG: ATP-binding protein, partial [Oscillospiraceae bacterium]|nr:ATP-binding protein [Oscillospiraceae bacterium]
MYNINVTQEAIEILKRRRLAAKNENNNRYEEIHSKIPQSLDITKELSLTSMNLMRIFRDFKGDERVEQFNELKAKNINLQQKLINLILENGYSSDFLDINYTCKKCNDMGYIGEKKCSCLEKLLSDITLRELVPQSGNSTFETFNLNFYRSQKSTMGKDAYEIMNNNFEYCKNYAYNFSENSKSIFMVGFTGLGKTHLSLAITNVVAKKGYCLIFGSISEQIRIIENEHFNKNGYNGDTLKELLDTDFLILDDLGTEFKTEFNENTLYEVINTRINNKKPTIISTNLTIEEIQYRYNTRIT